MLVGILTATLWVPYLGILILTSTNLLSTFLITPHYVHFRVIPGHTLVDNNNNGSFVLPRRPPPVHRLLFWTPTTSTSFQVAWSTLSWDGHRVAQFWELSTIFNIYWLEIRLESVSEWHNSTISKTASEEISPCRFSKNYGNLITTIGKYNLRSPIHNLCHPAHRSQSSHWPLQSCWPIPPLPSTLGAMKMRDSRKYIVWIDWLMIFPNTSNLIRTPWHFKIKI